MLNDRYSILTLYVCPFKLTSGINMVPDFEYPPRLCVIDREEGIAVDVENELQYDFLATHSRLYIGAMVDKLVNSRRVAIPAILSGSNGECDYSKALEIMENLKQGKKYPDGNETLNNEEYLKLVLAEDNKNNNSMSKKIKQLKKRRK